MQTPSCVVLEERFVGLLIVPGLEGRARFHGREDVDDAGMVASLGEDFLDPLFLAEILLLADELDLQTMLGGECLDVVPDLVAQGRGPLLEVKDPYAVGVEKCRDGVWVADVGERPLDDDPAKGYSTGC